MKTFFCVCASTSFLGAVYKTQRNVNTEQQVTEKRYCSWRWYSSIEKCNEHEQM